MAKKQSATPPEFILRFLRWFCPEHLIEEIEGDLVQRFARDVEMVGKQRASKKLIRSTLRFVRPGIILRNKFNYEILPLYMTRHFLTMFFRTSVKSGGYSIVNLSGLTIGLVVAIFIYLWINDEVSYNSFHDDKDRIYRVMANHFFDSGAVTYANTPGPLAEALMSLPEVEKAFHSTFMTPMLVRRDEQPLFENGIYADAEFFQVFNFPLLEGDASRPLPGKSCIAISKSLSEKYFKNESAIGKVLVIEDQHEVTITAVFQDIPDNSDIRFDLVLPYSLYAKSDPYNDEWGAWSGGATYVKLRRGADAGMVNKKIASSFTEPNIWVRWDDNVELFLFPLEKWRLYSKFENGRSSGGRIDYVRGFGIAGVFILLVACINFMNLATAQAISRSKEVAVRKVTGATHRSLISQFMVESILISFIAVMTATGLVHLSMPVFNGITGKNLSIDYSNPAIYGGLAAIALFTGVVAGCYPAFVLSSLKALNAMRGHVSGVGSPRLRKVLVVFQFVLSTVMVVGALAISKQIEFMRSKDLGFDRENVFFLNSNETLRRHFEAFRNEALQHPAIEFVSRGNSNPMDVFSEIVLSDDAWPGKTHEDDVSFKFIRCDHDFLSSLGFRIVEGRDFAHDFPADSFNYIISEEAARRMRLDDPVGQPLAAPHKGKIIGVVKDFHSTGLHAAIAPVIIALQPENTNRIFIRYKEQHAQQALEWIEHLHKKFLPTHPLEYAFLDKTFDRQYRDDIVVDSLARYFTAISILISCIGLFALASYIAVKRTKELGVRKVLGATALQLTALLCRDFLSLIVMALAIGIPLGWWITEKYLRGYAFHTDVDVALIIGTIGLMLLMALIAVAFQSIKAATANPVKTLNRD